MNNAIKALRNGDFKVIYPSQARPHKPTVRVEYKDLFLGLQRERTFETLDKTLEFVRIRAWQPRLYNHFTITILGE